MVNNEYRVLTGLTPNRVIETSLTENKKRRLFYYWFNIRRDLVFGEHCSAADVCRFFRYYYTHGDLYAVFRR